MNLKRLRFDRAENGDGEDILNIWISGLIRLDPELKITENMQNDFRENFDKRAFPFDFWIAKINDNVVGWCSVIPAFSHPLKKNSNGEVSTYISELFNYSGIGTTIMKYVFSELANTEIESIFGFANKMNAKSIKMCKNAGMRVCGQTSKRTILIKEFN